MLCYLSKVGVSQLNNRQWRYLIPAQIVCVLALFFAVNYQAIAQSIDSRDKYFKAGLSAFRSGDYRKAGRDFEAARRAGMKSVALHYNLGVTYYHLGRYSSATGMFKRLLRNRKWEALANYNLGLIALKQERKKAAIQHFRLASKTVDKKLHTLATVMLSRLGQQLGGRWRSYFRAGIGYDDNVALINGGEVSATSGNADFFTELFASMRYQVTGSAINGFRFDVTAYALKYQSLSGFDYQNVHLKASYARVGEQWRTLLRGDSAYYYDDGLPSYRTTSFIMNAKRKWHGALVQLYSNTSRYDDIDSAHNYLIGWRQQVSAQLEWPKKDWRVGLVYGLELNDRLDYTSGTEFFSYSPTRHRIGVFTTLNLNPRWKLNVGTAYRRSDFPDTDTHDIGGTPESRARRDNQVNYWMKLSRKLTNHWEVVSKLSYTDNHSNFSDTSYTRNIFSLSLARRH